MIKVLHAFGVGTGWMEKMAASLGGSVKGNRFIVPPEIYTGSHSVYMVSSDITALLADVTYHRDLLFQLRNTEHDFVGVYYNLSEGGSAHVLEEIARPMGRWEYNLAVVDSVLHLDYQVKAGAKTSNLCIFIKKDALKTYLVKAGVPRDTAERIFDAEQNTIVRYGRMSNAAWHLLKELREKDSEGMAFGLFLGATVYRLLGDYLEELVKEDIVIGRLDNTDLSAIIATQHELVQQLEAPFPGITTLAEAARMSETKFKELYRKITGMTPGAFFMNNKIERARELLHTGEYTVAEVAGKLGFSGASHLSALFKTHFGMQPKEYSNLL